MKWADKLQNDCLFCVGLRNTVTTSQHFRRIKS